VIDPKHVALNDTICIIKLSCADCHLVRYLNFLIMVRVKAVAASTSALLKSSIFPSSIHSSFFRGSYWLLLQIPVSYLFVSHQVDTYHSLLVSSSPYIFRIVARFINLFLRNIWPITVSPLPFTVKNAFCYVSVFSSCCYFTLNCIATADVSPDLAVFFFTTRSIKQNYTNYKNN
jgi:hypothetical protein